MSTINSHCAKQEEPHVDARSGLGGGVSFWKAGEIPRSFPGLYLGWRVVCPNADRGSSGGGGGGRDCSSFRDTSISCPKLCHDETHRRLTITLTSRKSSCPILMDSRNMNCEALIN
uniref:Uncharacterized protein n=1 Tax=Mesocestoides corti TaxID=53468 RepID=A0A5K3FI85_MESCO